MQLSRLLVRLERCHAMTIRSKSKICFLSVEQLAAQRGKAGTHNIGNPFVSPIGDDMQQFLDAFASDWCDNTKLGTAER